jgi:amino acid permease
MASTDLLSQRTTTYGTTKNGSDEHSDNDPTDELPAECQPAPPVQNGLRRGLSARQVQMIAIGGTIGTGLFLGTGRSLAQGGPASMLICYGIIGFVVYVTLLLLGEMATQYPVAGEFRNLLICFDRGRCPNFTYWHFPRRFRISPMLCLGVAHNPFSGQYLPYSSPVYVRFALHFDRRIDQ